MVLLSLEKKNVRENLITVSNTCWKGIKKMESKSFHGCPMKGQVAQKGVLIGVFFWGGGVGGVGAGGGEGV